MRTRSTFLPAITAALVGLQALAVAGQAVTITNPSFEQGPIQGSSAPSHEIRTVGPTGWTYLPPTSASNGLLNVPTWYNGGTPSFDGAQAAFIEGGSGATQQTLAATLQPNTTYTLTVGVGSRAKDGDKSWGGYHFTLGTTSGKVVGDWVGVNRNITVRGTAADTARSFTTGPNPPGLGEPLQITISQPYVDSGQRYSDFDNVRLTATRVTPHPADTPIDVVIVAGQSNAHGWSANTASFSGPNRYYTDSPNPDALLAYKQKNLPDPAYNTGSFGRLAPQGAGFGGDFNGFGPELSLGTNIADKTNCRIAIIKYAVGSAGLDKEFAKSANELYPIMIGFISDSLAQLREQGFAPRLVAVFWLQGETDAGGLTGRFVANPGAPAVYGANIAQFVRDLRSDLNATKLKFFLTEINPNTKVMADKLAGLSLVNQGMKDLAAADRDVYFIPTADIAGGFADIVHYTAEQEIMIGQRWAAAYLSSLVDDTTVARAAEPAAVPETKEQRDARLAWWREARFGMFIHWGPVSLKGTEISVSRGRSNPVGAYDGPIPVEVYDNLHREFNPTKFDAKQWVAIAKAAGMKYIVLVAKHVDGFCLWHSKASEHNMSKTPFGRDICGELAKAAAESGIRIGWYYSPMDCRNTDCRTERNAKYVALMHSCLRELLTNYGPISILWFDTDAGPNPWDQDKTFQLCRTLQPQIIVNNRLDMGSVKDFLDQQIGPHGDYYTPEQRVGAFDIQRPWETCETIGTQWAWKPDDEIKSPRRCVETLVRCVGNDGNLLLNVGPMPTGEIEPRQVARLKAMGQWLDKYGESIYGTRGGPFKPVRSVVSTHKGNNIYVHVLRWHGPTITLPALPRKIIASSVLIGGTVQVTQTDQQITLTVPEPDPQGIDTLVKLQLDGPAGDIAPLEPVVVCESLAWRKKATASNVLKNRATTASKAIDDDSATQWATDPGTKQVWLAVDLGKPMTFDRVEIEEASAGQVQSFELQYKDGEAWKTFYKGTTIGETFATPKFDAITAQHVRLSILDATDAPTIAEFQLFKPQGSGK